MDLKADMFLGSEHVDSEDDTAFESVEIDYEQLEALEMEKERFINVRKISKTAQMLAHVIDEHTVISYPGYFRTKFEVRNGYKHATLRGAGLDETTVFNLYFRCQRGKLRTDGIALMTLGPNNEEWIMLCPDNTQKRIASER